MTTLPAGTFAPRLFLRAVPLRRRRRSGFACWVCMLFPGENNRVLPPRRRGRECSAPTFLDSKTRDARRRGREGRLGRTAVPETGPLSRRAGRWLCCRLHAAVPYPFFRRRAKAALIVQPFIIAQTASPGAGRRQAVSSVLPRAVFLRTVRKNFVTHQVKIGCFFSVSLL